MRIKCSIYFDAHALLSALLISVIISIIISAALLLRYLNNENWLRYQRNQRVERNIQSAINLVLADTTTFNIQRREDIDLFGEGQDSIQITRELWGVFNLATVKSFQGTKVATKSFVFGKEMKDTLNSCLYLTDHQRPLQISGNTTLSGDAFLPKAGIRSVNIEGNQYPKNEPVSGKIFKSDTGIIPVNFAMLEHLREMLDLKKTNQVGNDFTANFPDSICNSFKNDITYLFVKQKQDLEGKQIKGKVILLADSLIEVPFDAILDNVIIVAPEIVIDSGFAGSVQLLASKEIRIGRKCRLEYPSAAILIKRPDYEIQGKINVEEGAMLSGLIFAFSDNSDPRKNFISLSKSSIINGLVYVNGSLFPSGVVFGTVICDYLMYKSPVATYENSLINAIIDRQRLSPDFIIPALVKGSGRKNIMKWVN